MAEGTVKILDLPQQTPTGDASMLMVSPEGQHYRSPFQTIIDDAAEAATEAVADDIAPIVASSFMQIVGTNANMTFAQIRAYNGTPLKSIAVSDAVGANIIARYLPKDTSSVDSGTTSTTYLVDAAGRRYLRGTVMDQIALSPNVTGEIDPTSSTNTFTIV